MKNYVTGFMFSKNGLSVALIMREKPAWQKGKLNGVGGKIEKYDETIYHAMSREFYEETGVQIPEQEWDHYVTLKGEDYVCNFFRTFTDKVYDCDTQEEEEIMVIEHSVLDMWEHIPNLRYLIPLALDKTIKHVTVEDIGN